MFQGRLLILPMVRRAHDTEARSSISCKMSSWLSAKPHHKTAFRITEDAATFLISSSETLVITLRRIAGAMVLQLPCCDWLHRVWRQLLFPNALDYPENQESTLLSCGQAKLSQFADALRKNLCSAIRQIITSNGSNHYIFDFILRTASIK